MNKLANRKKTEIAELSEKVAELEGAIRGLQKTYDRSSEVVKLEEQIERLKIEKDRLVENNARELRETTHKVGLVKVEHEHEIANAIREAKLDVREGNLDEKEKLFVEKLEFQTKHLDGEINRLESLATKLFDRIPNLNATLALGGPVKEKKS